MTRRLITALVLGILLAAQAAPLAASGRHCAMQRPAPSGPCTGCDLDGGPAREVSLSAGSCCRFEAATPRTQAPGIVPSPQRDQDTASPLALLPVSPRFECAAPGRPDSDLPQPRSTDSPISLHNTLRL